MHFRDLVAAEWIKLRSQRSIPWMLAVTALAVRTTTVAVPARGSVVLAKAVVIAAARTLAGAINSTASFAASQAILHGRDADVSITDPGAFPALLGATLLAPVYALIGLGFGVLIRHSIATTGAAIVTPVMLPCPHRQPVPVKRSYGGPMTINLLIGGKGMSRRRVLGAALAAGVAVPIGVTRPAWAAPASPGPARLTLPVPTGPYPLGTMSLHLVDKSRPDPVAGPGHYREVMASIWYPARNVSRYPLARWMLAAPMRELLVSGGFEPDVAVAPVTAAREGAPVLCASEPWPVIVFSHGAHDHRSDATIVVQELASHGYVVVTVDHTYDAFSEFSDGRLAVPLYDYPMYPGDFSQDIQFVLDQIEVLAAGRNPDAGHRPLPAGLGAALDLHRVGMFGWSKGATATALVMGDDQRIRAGLSFDGPMESEPPVPAELSRPFMLMTAVFTRAADPNVAEFWSHLTGWRLNVQAEGAVHSSYCDLQWLLPQVARATGMSGEELQGWIGTLNPARAVRIQQAYPLAFFDLHLRERRGHLLDGPSPAFPEVKFIR